MKKLKFLSFFLLIALLFSCGAKKDRVAKDTLYEFIGALPALPSGSLYLSEAALYDEEKPLTNELLLSLYAKADGSMECEGLVREAALYLGSSPDAPFEIAVFVLFANSDTDALLRMCRRRASLVSGLFPEAEKNARYFLLDNLLVFCLSPDPSAAERAFQRLK